MVPSRLQTSRLGLRPPRPEDAEQIFFGYAQDPDVVRFMLWRAHQSLDQTRKFVQVALESWASNVRFPWIITRRGRDDVLGMIELRLELCIGDVGFVLRRDQWGHGYATEALRAVLATANEIPALDRVWAICHVDNTASARVMEKAGMKREDLWERYETFPNISDDPQDVYCYGMEQ